MIGFDRGGAYAQVFRHCREQQVHWVSYRRAPLAVPAKLPVITTVSRRTHPPDRLGRGESAAQGLRDARQITLFEHGKVALQILTSDSDSCPAEILSWLKSRWREENFLKYASENYGIDKICDYLAVIETNTKVIANPARMKANAAVRDAEKALAAAERDLATLLADPAIAPAAKNTTLIPAAQQKITAARKQRLPPPGPATRSPRNSPPTPSTPMRRSRCCAPGAAACRWSCACWPTTPSTGSQPPQRLPPR